MVYTLKAVQYIRDKSRPGKWIAVDSITLVAEYDFEQQPQEKTLRNLIKRDARKLLGRNWVVVDIYAKI